MNTRCFLLFALVGFLAGGCGSNRNFIDPRVVMHNDFESLNGWLPADQLVSLTQEQAHSGRYALKVSTGHEFSATFRKPLSQLFDTRPTKITVSAWALLSSPQAQATLVMDLHAPTAAPDAKPLLWAGLALADVAKEANKWVAVSKTIELPATTPPETILTMYLWSPDGQTAYLDDIVVRQE